MGSFDLLRALSEHGLKRSLERPIEDFGSLGVKLLDSTPEGE